MARMELSTARAASLSPSLSRFGSASIERLLSKVTSLDSVDKSALSLTNQKNKAMALEIVTVRPTDPKYLCPVCGQLLRYPLQFEKCGHRCCSACLPELLRVTLRCPVDQVTIDKKRTFVDRALQRELDVLTVRCIYHNKGCHWTGEMRNLMTHAEDCLSRPVSCPNECGLKIAKVCLDTHLQETCTKRKITCLCCQATISSRDEVEHMKTCGKFPIICPNGCGVREMPRVKLADHLNECKKQTVNCPYADAGCSYQCERRDLEAHFASKYDKHLRLVTDAVAKAAEVDQKSHLMELSSRVAMVQARLENLRKIHAPFTLWKIEDFDEKRRKATKIDNSVLVSPHLSARTYGHRLQMRVHLYGDELVYGQHMSVYLSICQNEYDRLVPWPFANKVTITLLDQCDEAQSRSHVTRVIDPAAVDAKGTFERPNGRLSAPFGLQKFTTLENLMKPGHYVKDNAIFLHIQIDG